ncbi:MAG: hypothetical protein WCW30_05390 [Candidatus Gracilibacteria bacterium]
MKKLLLISLLILTLGFLGCGEEGTDAPDYSNETYRKVVLEGTVTLKVDPTQWASQSKENEGAVVCAPSGNFKIQLYFPVEGGTILKQDNTMTLTDFNCAAYGSATQSCTMTPTNSAYTPRVFTFDQATLAVDQDVSTLVGTDEPMDILNFKREFPMEIDPNESIVGTSTCKIKTYLIDWFGVYGQLYAPFTGSSWMLEVPPGQSLTMQLQNSPLPAVTSSFFVFDMNYTQSETLVFDLNE